LETISSFELFGMELLLDGAELVGAGGCGER
jgi:hypothetical protein